MYKCKCVLYNLKYVSGGKATAGYFSGNFLGKDVFPQYFKSSCATGRHVLRNHSQDLCSGSSWKVKKYNSEYALNNVNNRTWNENLKKNESKRCNIIKDAFQLNKLETVYFDHLLKVLKSFRRRHWHGTTRKRPK